MRFLCRVDFLISTIFPTSSRLIRNRMICVNSHDELQAARLVAHITATGSPYYRSRSLNIYRLSDLLSRLLTRPSLPIGPTYSQRSPMDEGGTYGRGLGTRPRSYADNHGHSPNQSRRFGQASRVVSDPALYGQNSHGVYPSHGYQQSYDTVASASNGSGATDQWGNSTDPSSENSSIDRVQPAPKPELGEQYGFNGFGGAPQFQGPILEEHGTDSPAYGQPGYGQSHAAARSGFPFQGNDLPPPPPPPHVNQRQPAPRTPIKLGGSAPPANGSPPTPSSEKRKSWLKRRFSKG